MAKIGTFEDFRNFAIDKTNAKPSVIDATVKDFITPFILEERKMNVTQLDVFSRLMYERIVFLSGEVTPESMNTITAQLLYLDSVDNRDINIYINTPGGDCYSGLQLVSVMDFIKSDVATTVLGMAASMGAVIASSGAKGKRFALPNAEIMIHQPLGGTQGQATDMEIEVEHMLRIKKNLISIMAENAGKDYETVLADCERNNWMTAKEAMEYGLIDKVVENRN